MKKILLLAVALVLSAGVYAQKNGFVNTELIFKSMPEYNKAIEEIDQYAQQEQAKIEAEYARIAEMYERYQYQKQSLSETSRKQVEDNIIRLEKEAGEKQRSIFGTEGTLLTKRLEMLKPIQDKVFNMIDALAQQQGYDLILDISNNPSIVYYDKKKDLSEQVMNSLGIRK